MDIDSSSIFFSSGDEGLGPWPPRKIFTSKKNVNFRKMTLDFGKNSQRESIPYERIIRRKVSYQRSNYDQIDEFSQQISAFM